MPGYILNKIRSRKMMFEGVRCSLHCGDSLLFWLFMLGGRMLWLHRVSWKLAGPVRNMCGLRLPQVETWSWLSRWCKCRNEWRETLAYLGWSQHLTSLVLEAGAWSCSHLCIPYIFGTYYVPGSLLSSRGANCEPKSKSSLTPCSL